MQTFHQAHNLAQAVQLLLNSETFVAQRTLQALCTIKLEPTNASDRQRCRNSYGILGYAAWDRNYIRVNFQLEPLVLACVIIHEITHRLDIRRTGIPDSGIFNYEISELEAIITEWKFLNNTDTITITQARNLAKAIGCSCETDDYIPLEYC